MDLFETGIETLKHIKNLRNHYSHPERHSFGGIIFWNRVEFINRLINEMYEDVKLRSERKILAKQFISQQQNTNLDKFLVIEIQEKPTILFSLQLLFINNKQTPHTYLFACTPLFDLESDQEYTIKVPFVFKAKLIHPIFSENTLTGESFSAKQKVRFSPITLHQNLVPIFEKWDSEYAKKKNKFQYESSMTFHVPEIFIPEIQAFQKM